MTHAQAVQDILERMQDYSAPATSRLPNPVARALAFKAARYDDYGRAVMWLAQQLPRTLQSAEGPTMSGCVNFDWQQASHSLRTTAIYNWLYKIGAIES